MRAIVLILLLAPLSLFADSIHAGKVIKIADGDTLTTLVANRQLKIRLADIDTPERQQPFGTGARQARSDRAFGRIHRNMRVSGQRNCPGYRDPSYIHKGYKEWVDSLNAANER